MAKNKDAAGAENSVPPSDGTDPDIATMSFESALSALETLVEQMEDGDLSLEQAVRFYEKGVALQRRCQQTLETAEQKVRILSESTENAPLAPFEPTGESP